MARRSLALTGTQAENVALESEFWSEENWTEGKRGPSNPSNPLFHILKSLFTVW